MAHQGRQKLPCLGMVLAGLAASEGMGEGIKAVDGPCHKILIVPHHLLDHIVDAAHRGNDPDLIADGGAAILSAEALEGLRLHLFRECEAWGIGVLHLTFQVGLYVMGVHPGSRSGILGGMTDRKAIFYHIFTLFDGKKGDLMALGDVHKSFNSDPSGGDLLAFCDGVESHCHVVQIRNPYCFHISNYRQLANAAFAPSVRIIFKSAVTVSSSPAIFVRS